MVGPEAKPSAMQNETERQVAAHSSSSAPEGSAEGITVHVVPFHTLINVEITEAPLTPVPTAAQNDGPTQDTPFSVPVTPAGSGLVMRVHEVPFQCSIREDWLLTGV